MPTFNFRRIDLDLIFPPFLEKILNVVASCNERGFPYHATRGYDTYGAQMALWAKGRTMRGIKVTNAKGGQSAHNFGLAVDFVLDSQKEIPGIQPDWSAEAYRVLIEEAKKVGLHSGMSYNDYPHIGWSGYVSGEDMVPLAAAWEKSADTGPSTLARLQQVWKTVENKE